MASELSFLHVFHVIYDLSPYQAGTDGDIFHDIYVNSLTLGSVEMETVFNFLIGSLFYILK